MLKLTLPGKAIKNIFSPPKPVLPPPPPPLPSREDIRIQDKKKAQGALDKKRAGIGDSILTSGLGVTEAAKVKKPSLLGSVKDV